MCAYSRDSSYCIKLCRQCAYIVELKRTKSSIRVWKFTVSNVNVRACMLRTATIFMQFPLNGLTINVVNLAVAKTAAMFARFNRLLLIFIECRTTCLWMKCWAIIFFFSWPFLNKFNSCDFVSRFFFQFALSVDDASGHYTPGLFYGNHYWMGSLSLCNSIYKPPSSITPIITTGKWLDSRLIHRSYESSTHSFLFRRENLVQTKKVKDAISYNDFSPVETTHENPPFLPGFFVLKAKINETEVARYVSWLFS